MDTPSAVGLASKVPPLGRLETIDPRTIWSKEARDFTPWLLANPDHLAEALGIELDLSIAEHPVGNFSLDLIGKDHTNNAVLIVENQLAGSDHGHLGQLLTYAAGTGASTIVWIATTFREEHRQALDWMNEHTDETVRFFGIQIEAVRIGDSLPAPLLKVVSQPNDWQKQVRSSTPDASSGGRSALYVDFWTGLLERMQAQHPEWRRPVRPSSANWMMIRTVGGLGLSISFAAGGRIRTEVYIDTGDAEQNISILGALSKHADDIAGVFGHHLEWEELPGKRACRVADYAPGDVREAAKHPEYTDWFLQGVGRWNQVLDRYSSEIQGSAAATSLSGTGSTFASVPPSA